MKSREEISEEIEEMSNFFRATKSFKNFFYATRAVNKQQHLMNNSASPFLFLRQTQNSSENSEIDGNSASPQSRRLQLFVGQFRF